MAAGRFVVRRVALAATLVCGGVQAAITTTGSYDTSTGAVLGPGDTVLPSTRAWIGAAGGTGSLSVDAGSFLQLAQLSFGSNGVGNGTGLITGTGTRVELIGDNNQRLSVANWGTGRLTIADGALVDTSGNQAPCLVQFHYCDSFVGAAAGDTARLTVTGAGTRLRTGQQLFIGAPILNTLPVNGFAWGVPGGTTSATVEVLAGAALVVDRAQVGTDQWSSGNTGFERSVSQVTVSGTGSRWVAVGGQQWHAVTGVPTTFAASISTAHDRYAVANIAVLQGGTVEVQGPAGVFNYINLTAGGGHSDMRVDGSGSKVAFTGPNAVLNVGRSLGTARLDVTAGGVVEGMYFVGIGRDGSFGTMLLDGSGSRVSVTQFADQALQGANRSPAVSVGSNGTGTLTVRNGARLEVAGSGQAAGNSPNIILGAGAGSSGTLDIQGSGTLVEVRSNSVQAGGGPGEAYGAYVGVGQQGGGTLNVSGGARLVLSSTVVSTDADRRTTVLNVGGANDNTTGARGIAAVRGAGSEIALEGDERFVAIGRGPSSFGHLTLADAGKLAATTVNVGRQGGIGVLEMDDGRIELTGQFAAPVAALTSTGFGIGVGTGTGVVRMANGSVISMSNQGSGGMGMTLGGSTNFEAGDGSLTMSGGSSVTIAAAPGLATFTVGRQGSALLRMSGNSSIHIGDGRFFVARESGSDGSVIATGGSVINAGWVGVGRNQLNGADAGDGGTATLILNGATLNVAGDVHIGTNGFLGGSAGSINVGGTVYNNGIFSPGNSPGTFTIDGDYVAGAGSRLILEVQGSTGGGFETDLVYFKQGRALDLAELNVEFRFLGGTSPDEFEQSGRFDIDTFLAVQTAGGQTVEIDHALLAGVNYSARADAYTFTSFDFSADGGATFVAVPVPEPGSWALMLAGGGVLAGLVRRRRAVPR